MCDPHRDMETKTRPTLIMPGCSKNEFRAMKRSRPVIAQKSLAVTIATAVNTPRRTAEFDHDGGGYPNPPGPKAKVLLFGIAPWKTPSFMMPPITNAEKSAILIAGKSHRHDRIVAIKPGVSDFPTISDRPAGAAERTPKGLQSGYRNLAGPSAGVIIAVYAARVGTECPRTKVTLRGQPCPQRNQSARLLVRESQSSAYREGLQQRVDVAVDLD